MNIFDEASSSGSPLVSVVVPTYQHVRFIEQCIESILQQRTTFPFEILIGEDESRDGTREICQRVASEYPDRIRLFLRSRADVMMIMGQATGRANVLQLYRESRGKYIAICEGDDRWIDPEKLQRQVDALEADPSAAGCFTDAFNERDGIREPFMNGVYASLPRARLVDQKDIVRGQGIPTCTFVFRKELVEDIGKVIRRSPVGDTILYVHLSGKGHFIFQPERTAVRVMHPGGIHSLKGRTHKLVVQYYTLFWMDKASNEKYSAYLQKKQMNVLLEIWASTAGKENSRARWAWWRIARRRKEAGWNGTTLMRNFLICQIPMADRLYRALFAR